MANYSINSTIKHGKYTEKVDASHLNQVYLETGDTQVLTEAAVTIGGTTYPVGTQLSTILGALGNAGGQYKIVAGATANIVKIQVSNNGGTTWTDVSSVTVNNVANATNATNATNVNLSASGTGTSSITITAGSGSSASFTVDKVAEATKATNDGAGNNIASTYATKDELEAVEEGITRGYVTDATKAPAAIVKDKTASQQTATLSGAGSATITLVNGTVKYEDLKVGDNIYLTDDGKCDWFIASITGTSTLTITLYSVEADSPALSGYVTGSGLTANNIILGNGNNAVKDGGVSISSTALASTAAGVDTHVLTEKATATTIDNRVSAAIGALDVSNITGFGAGKTLSTLTETDGKISATFQDISIGVSQITDFPSIPTILSGSAGQVYGWNGSSAPEAQSIFTGLNAAGTSLYASRIANNMLALPDTGITAGTYGAVQVNAKGFAIAGGQTLVFASSLSDTKLDALVNGGCGIIYED